MYENLFNAANRFWQTKQSAKMRSLTKALLLLTLLAFVSAQYSDALEATAEAYYDQRGSVRHLNTFLDDSLAWVYSIVNRLVTKVIVVVLCIVQFILPTATYEGAVPKPLQEMYNVYKYGAARPTPYVVPDFIQ